MNVRSWPEGAVPSPEQAPPIATAIDMHEVDVETLRETGRVFTGHQGFTATETAFYLYSDVSRDLVTSGSESCRGCVWDRARGCLVASLPHDACVNSVAICPQNQVKQFDILYSNKLPKYISFMQEICVTASDDHKLKVWQSHRRVRHQRQQEERRRRQQQQQQQ